MNYIISPNLNHKQAFHLVVEKRNQGRNEERKEHDMVTVREKKNGKSVGLRGEICTVISPPPFVVLLSKFLMACLQLRSKNIK